MDYTTQENKMTVGIEDDYYARTVNVTTQTATDVLALITGPGSILKETETNAVINDYWKSIIKIIGQGNQYRDEFISIRIDIVGAFDGESDRFDPARHELKLSVTPSRKVKNVLQAIKLHYVKPEKEVPEHNEVYDWTSNTVNEELSPQGALVITGYNLKVYDELEGQGVVFINNEDNSETLVNSFRTNTPQKLELRVPNLVAGEYRIEIRNTTRNGKLLRIGTLAHTFMVY